MEEEFDRAADDPEIAALLRFEPVPRKQSRAGGWWSPENQRIFIRMLAETGNYRIAAEEVGLSANSAYQLRKEAGSDDFRRAWEEAVALHRKRNGGPGRHARELREARARRAAEPDLDEAEKGALLDEFLNRYLTKLKAERAARLEGRIVEADFCVRQLTFLELVLDIGGRAQALLERMKQGDRHLAEVAATPGSTLLERLRRTLWLEKGEADRPPPAPLGSHNAFFATGRDEYDPERDGDRKDWERRQAQKQRLAAEAQAEWERRGRAEGAGEPSPLSSGEIEGPPPDSPNKDSDNPGTP